MQLYLGTAGGAIVFKIHVQARLSGVMLRYSFVVLHASNDEWQHRRTTVGSYPRMPALKRNIFDAPEEHDEKVRWQNYCNLHFANDNDTLAEEEQELEALVES